jgi:serine protease Do
MKRCLLIVACLALGGLGTYLGQSLLQGRAPTAAPAVSRETTSYRDVVKKVLPAVVSIEAQSRAARVRPGRPDDMSLPGGVRPFFALPRQAAADAPARVGFGSGFIIDKGVIVTNNHVVEGADRVVVQMQDGRKFTSTKIRTDPRTDLAIVLLDVKKPLPALEFGDSNDMEIGDRVLAVGAPFRLTGTVTHGIISSKGRALRMNDYEDFLQTDAAINPGNSGGPLVNLDGKVIGINSAIKSRSGGFQGIGLAIASNLGKTIVTALVKDGKVRRGYLGVVVSDVDEEMVKELGLKEARGVLVTRVRPRTPGARAGLKKDDVIIKLGKKPVRDGRDLQIVVAGLPLGKPVEVEVFRAGKPVTLKVTIVEQPKGLALTLRELIRETDKAAIPIEKAGLSVVDLTPELAERLGYPDETTGVLIWSISETALQAGIKRGVLLLSVDKKPVKTAKEAAGAFAKASVKKGIRLEIKGPKDAKKTVILKVEEDD